MCLFLKPNTLFPTPKSTLRFLPWNDDRVEITRAAKLRLNWKPLDETGETERKYFPLFATSFLVKKWPPFWRSQKAFLTPFWTLGVSWVSIRAWNFPFWPVLGPFGPFLTLFWRPEITLFSGQNRRFLDYDKVEITRGSETTPKLEPPGEKEQIWPNQTTRLREKSDLRSEVRFGVWGPIWGLRSDLGSDLGPFWGPFWAQKEVIFGVGFGS
jgi:hypothetical protein